MHYSALVGYILNKRSYILNNTPNLTFKWLSIRKDDRIQSTKPKISFSAILNLILVSMLANFYCFSPTSRCVNLLCVIFNSMLSVPAKDTRNPRVTYLMRPWFIRRSILSHCNDHYLVSELTTKTARKPRSYAEAYLYERRICYFDSVHRPSLWKILKYYGIPDRFINIFKSLYINSSCCVKTASGYTEFFEIGSGVRQGCILSPFLFIISH